MVHAIHSGKNRENDFIAYSPSAAIDFSDVRFPGDRRRCEHCHVKDQYQIPLPDGLLASRWRDIDSTRAVVKSYYTGPTTGACIGCHDAQATELHAATMSLISPSDPTDIKESCANCHASGKEFGLDTVHARTGL
jgi:OmcA/MtrC family decaheme c-type cytochrome